LASLSTASSADGNYSGELGIVDGVAWYNHKGKFGKNSIFDRCRPFRRSEDLALLKQRAAEKGTSAKVAHRFIIFINLFIQKQKNVKTGLIITNAASASTCKRKKEKMVG